MALTTATPRAFKAVPKDIREWTAWIRDAFTDALTGTISTAQLADGSVTLVKLGGTITTAGKALLDDAAASDQRTTLGLGTAAVEAIGTSGANVPKLSTANTWTLAQTFSAPPVVPSYTVAGVPSATPAGQLAYISNETGGAVLAFSDGSVWKRVTDRATIS
jgi:hypothetical protein